MSNLEGVVNLDGKLLSTLVAAAQKDCSVRPIKTFTGARVIPALAQIPICWMYLLHVELYQENPRKSNARTPARQFRKRLAYVYWLGTDLLKSEPTNRLRNVVRDR